MDRRRVGGLQPGNDMDHDRDGHRDEAHNVDSRHDRLNQPSDHMGHSTGDHSDQSDHMDSERRSRRQPRNQLDCRYPGRIVESDQLGRPPSHHGVESNDVGDSSSRHIDPCDDVVGQRLRCHNQGNDMGDRSNRRLCTGNELDHPNRRGDDAGDDMGHPSSSLGFTSDHVERC